MIRIGDVLEDRYLIERRIGKGGNSIVYEGLQIRTGRKIAVKEIDRERAGSRAGKSLQYLKAIRHQGLPMILDVLETPKCVRIVMEYVPGHTLQKEMERRKRSGKLFSVEEVLQISLEIVDILQYLHAFPKSLVFRDLKPENIILCPDGKIMLVDLESICPVRWTDEEADFAIGTAGYAAPEQYKEEKVQSSQADLYALGAVMHYLLTGIAPGLEPFSFRRITAMNPSLLKGGPKKRMRVQRLEQIIDRCTCFRKEDRYQTSEELLEDLREIGNGSTGWIRNRKSVWALGLLLLAAFAATALFFRSGRMIDALREEGAAYCLMKSEGVPEEQLDLWISKALDFLPGNPEAFSVLLDRMLLDGAFSEEEQMRVRDFLDQTAEGALLDHEALLAQDKAAYIRFAYRLGTACLYVADGLPDYRDSGEWFRVVCKEGAQWISGDEEDGIPLLIRKAKMLEMICRYRGDILEGAFQTDAPVRLSEYWKNLTGLLQKEMQADQFLPAELVLWREVTGCLSDWAVELQNAGVSWKEQKEITDLVKKNAADLLEKTELQDYPAVKSQVEQLIRQADLVERKRQLLEEAACS